MDIQANQKDSKRPFYTQMQLMEIETIMATDFAVSIAGQRAYVTIKLDSQNIFLLWSLFKRNIKWMTQALFKNMIVSVSNDGENWTEIGRKENCEQDEEFKRIDFCRKHGSSICQIRNGSL